MHENRRTLRMFHLVALLAVWTLPLHADLLFETSAAQTNIVHTLNLPDRPADAPSGTELEEILRSLPLSARENRIFTEITSGNIPDYLRQLTPVTTTRVVNGTEYTATYHVAPDYLAVGSDEDYFLMPMTPLLAQCLANAMGFTMPTRRMVDQIWQAAPLKLNPQPIPPSDQMTTIPVMFTHNTMVREQRDTHIQQHPPGTLVAGHKKDVIISNRIYTTANSVVIYGWHYTNGNPIQPVFAGHGENYADYSHGIRAVADSVSLNGETVHIRQIVQHPDLHVLLSDEGVIPLPFYPLETTARVPDDWGIRRIGASSLQLIIPNRPEITAYEVHLSNDGRHFTQSRTLPATGSYLLEGLPPEAPVFVKMQAITDHAGPFSEVLAGMPTERESNILIVNGFDRPITGNTRDFIRMYVPGVLQAGHVFDAATNEAVAFGHVSLSAYETVIWILGAESTANETFSTAEQMRVRAFLDAGGNLLVSGSEIGWDLDNRGTSTDRAFMHNYLKSAYVADAPSNQQNTWYRVEGSVDGPFASYSDIRFDNGSHGTWNVSWPDVLRGEQGGEIVMRYRGAPTPNGAAVAYKGAFPESAAGVSGSVMVLGFPLETVYPSDERNELVRDILRWMMPASTNIHNETGNESVATLYLSQNFPNPFNAQTTLRYELPVTSHALLSIYNVWG